MEADRKQTRNCAGISQRRILTVYVALFNLLSVGEFKNFSLVFIFT